MSVESGEDVVIWADVDKIEASWKTDRNFYVGHEGAGGIVGRYPRFDAWFQTLPRPRIEMSELAIDPVGRATFGNGRHRFAWMRDHGAKAVPVIVPAEQADEFQQRFGASARQTIIR